MSDIGDPGRGTNRWLREFEKPRSTYGTWKRLIGLFSNELKSIAMVVGFVVAGGALGILFPIGIGQAIDAIRTGSSTAVYGLVIGLTLGFGVDFLLSKAEGQAMASISQRIVSHLRQTLFRSLARLPISTFDRVTSGDLMSRMTNDVENVSSSLSSSTLTLFNGSVAIVSTSIVMLCLSPALTAASFVSVVLVSLATKVIAFQTKKEFRIQQSLLGTLNSFAYETFAGFELFKSTQREISRIAQFEDLDRRVVECGRKAQFWAGLMMPITNVISNLSFVLIVFWGAWLVGTDPHVSIGLIATFLLFNRQFTRPINEISNVFNVFQSALAGIERLFEVFELPGELPDRPTACDLKSPRGQLRFINVDFSYRADVLVLKKINLDVDPGSSIALVGHTGCGKTTVANLLMRFYDVDEGHVEIDDRDVREYTRDSLRRQIGFVLQEPRLFPGTLAQNIAFGGRAVDRAAVEKAGRIAQLETLVQQWPKGYDTFLDEAAVSLSQGQIQLVAIARALYSDPAFLVLDEATSSLDSRTEALLQKAIVEAMKGRTSVVIAHRLSTIQDVDVIYVLENGSVVERGSHEALLRTGGTYARMARLHRPNLDFLN